MVTNKINKMKSRFLILLKKMRKAATNGYCTMFVSFIACFFSVLLTIIEMRETPSSYKYYSSLCSEVSQSIIEINDISTNSYYKEVSCLKSEIELFKENLLPFLSTLESLLIKQKYNHIVFKNYEQMLEEINDEFKKERTINEFAYRIAASYLPLVSDTSCLLKLNNNHYYSRDQLSLILYESLKWDSYLKKKGIKEKMNYIRDDNDTRSSKRAIKKLYKTYYSKEYYEFRKVQVSVFMDWYRTIENIVVYDTCYRIDNYDSIAATMREKNYRSIIKKIEKRHGFGIQNNE